MTAVTGSRGSCKDSQEDSFEYRGLGRVRALLKSHVFILSRFGPLFPATTLQPVGMDMVDSNTVIVDRSPQAADPSFKLKNTTNSRSSDIQELLNEDNPQTRKIYYFQNCGTVYMPVDSFNARGVRMKDCGNNVSQVTCLLFFFSFPFS